MGRSTGLLRSLRNNLLQMIPEPNLWSDVRGGSVDRDRSMEEISSSLAMESNNSDFNGHSNATTMTLSRGNNNSRAMAADGFKEEMELMNHHHHHHAGTVYSCAIVALLSFNFLPALRSSSPWRSSTSCRRRCRGKRGWRGRFRECRIAAKRRRHRIDEEREAKVRRASVKRVFEWHHLSQLDFPFLMHTDGPAGGICW